MSSLINEKNMQPILEFDKYYHIYNRGNNKEKLFLIDDNYRFFLVNFATYVLPVADVYAYCLLPNHFHFLIKIKSEEEIISLGKDIISKTPWAISDQFRKLFISYTMAFNKQQSRHGNLFHRQFKRIEVDRNDYLIYLVHYIHRNPIHHGLCKNYIEWDYSSYSTILSDTPTKLCRNEVLEWFGSKKDFSDFHKENLEYYKIEKLLIEESMTRIQNPVVYKS